MKNSLTSFWKKHHTIIRFSSKRLLAFAIDAMIYSIILSRVYFLFEGDRIIENHEWNGVKIIDFLSSFLQPLINAHPHIAGLLIFTLAITPIIYIPSLYFLLLLRWQTLGQWIAGVKTIDTKTRQSITLGNSFLWLFIFPLWTLFVLYVNLPFLLINKKHRSIISVLTKTDVIETPSAINKFFKYLRNL